MEGEAEIKRGEVMEFPEECSRCGELIKTAVWKDEGGEEHESKTYGMSVTVGENYGGRYAPGTYVFCPDCLLDTLMGVER